MNGFHDLIDEATYHADRTSVSVSGLKTILKAPALYTVRDLVALLTGERP